MCFLGLAFNICGIQLGHSILQSTLTMLNPLPLLSSHSVLLVVGLIVLGVALQIYQSRAAGLGHIPGPFLAKYTNVWRLIETRRTGGDADYMHAMHKVYGDVVRVGPHAVSVADPQSIPLIYGTKARLHKVQSGLKLIQSLLYAN